MAHWPARRLSVLSGLVVFVILSALLLVSTRFGDVWLSAGPFPFPTKNPVKEQQNDPYAARTVLSGPPGASFRGRKTFLFQRSANDAQTRYCPMSATLHPGALPLAGATTLSPSSISSTSAKRRIESPCCRTTPPHISLWEAQGQLSFGEAFDVPRLAKALGRPVLEWNDIKLWNGTQVTWDTIGCWDLWSKQSEDKAPRESFGVTHRLGLDIAYTPAPDYVRASDFHIGFPALTTLAWPASREVALAETTEAKPSPGSHHTSPPDEQLLCFDFLYYVGSFHSFEIGLQYSPAWNTVGRHMHWNPSLDRLVDLFLQALFGLADGTTIPPFISIHARHTDFAAYCKPEPGQPCFTSLDAYTQEVERLQRRIFERKGIEVKHVVVTSDETDPSWWAGVKAAGWFVPDHDGLGTADYLGVWYPVLIDAVIQSRGHGFIGTEGSTMSILAARRVEDWQDGEASLLRFN
ncbi:hypothetical protein HMN09_00891300 [Mycena chlorophos]|uniref:Uncharacterized protein n=1 Tax=Mycena chlorophos TaxID=658473 RepID=A0A8H6W5J7_MYCCL|nr:hypothetical protein HMN09_00891300 [Mycena chlorophos]